MLRPRSTWVRSRLIGAFSRLVRDRSLWDYISILNQRLDMVQNSISDSWFEYLCCDSIPISYASPGNVSGSDSVSSPSTPLNQLVCSTRSSSSISIQDLNFPSTLVQQFFQGLSQQARYAHLSGFLVRGPWYFAWLPALHSFLTSSG